MNNQPIQQDLNNEGNNAITSCPDETQITE